MNSKRHTEYYMMGDTMLKLFSSFLFLLIAFSASSRTALKSCVSPDFFTDISSEISLEMSKQGSEHSTWQGSDENFELFKIYRQYYSIVFARQKVEADSYIYLGQTEIDDTVITGDSNSRILTSSFLLLQKNNSLHFLCDDAIGLNQEIIKQDFSIILIER